MSKPLALIEGDLALPNARLLSGLPPPFGWRRLNAWSDLRVPRHQSASPDRKGKIPPRVRHLFFYQLPKRQDNLHHFKDQLAEARRYLEADRTPMASSRRDHVLGACIFIGCSIALAWLLATCSSHDSVDKLAAQAKQHVVSNHASADVAQAVPRVDRGTAGAAHSDPRVIPTDESRPANSGTEQGPTAHERLWEAARLAEPALPARHPESPHLARESRHIGTRDRVAPSKRALSVALTPKVQIAPHIAFGNSSDASARPVLPRQVERTALSSSANDEAERAALLEWAIQQRRAQAPATPRVASSSGSEWNAHMTQRRITDNPAAFQAGRTSQ